MNEKDLVWQPPYDQREGDDWSRRVSSVSHLRVSIAQKPYELKLNNYQIPGIFNAKFLWSILHKPEHA